MSKPLLLVLFLAGLLIAVAGSGVESTLSFADLDEVISVNDQPIAREEFNRAKLKNPNLTESQLLTLMVDNLLLLQRAEELGLVHSDRVIRKVIVQRMVELEVQKALSKKITDQSLRTFYKSNLLMFTPADQFQVQIASLKKDSQCSQAQLVKTQWDKTKKYNQSWSKHRLHQPLGNSLHSETLVYRQLGNHLAEQVTQLETGEMSIPIAIENRCLLLLLVDKKIGLAAEFNDVKDLVMSEYRVRSRKKALADLLIELRTKAEIYLAQDIAKVLTNG